MSLYEFCGVCEKHELVGDGLNAKCSCGSDYYGLPHMKIRDNPVNFHTHEGYALLHKTMGEKRYWFKFYCWYSRNECPPVFGLGDCAMRFHELTDPAQKSDLIAEWLKEDE